MKIIGKNGGLVTVRVIPDEIVPMKAMHLPTMFGAIAARYQCAGAPTLESAASSGARFRNGRFAVGDQQINIIELSVYNDGASVVTSDTADSEIVLNDLRKWLESEFQFREPISPEIRGYQSELVVQFDNHTDSITEPFADLVDFVRGASTTPRPFAFSRFAIGAEPGTGLQPEFLVERRAQVPWELGYYFSKATLTTSAHIRALEMFDSLLGAAR